MCHGWLPWARSEIGGLSSHIASSSTGHVSLLSGQLVQGNFREGGGGAFKCFDVSKEIEQQRFLHAFMGEMHQKRLLHDSMGMISRPRGSSAVSKGAIPCLVSKGALPCLVCKGAIPCPQRGGVPWRSRRHPQAPGSDHALPRSSCLQPPLWGQPRRGPLLLVRKV